MNNAGIVTTIILLMLSSSTYAQKLTKNPFHQPLENRKEKTPDLSNNETVQLKGTLVSKEHALININGQILTIGDSFGQYSLESITEGSAVFSKGGEKMTLTVNEP